MVLRRPELARVGGGSSSTNLLRETRGNICSQTRQDCSRLDCHRNAEDDDESSGSAGGWCSRLSRSREAPTSSEAHRRGRRQSSDAGDELRRKISAAAITKRRSLTGFDRGLDGPFGNEPREATDDDCRGHRRLNDSTWLAEENHLGSARSNSFINGRESSGFPRADDEQWQRSRGSSKSNNNVAHEKTSVLVVVGLTPPTASAFLDTRRGKNIALVIMNKSKLPCTWKMIKILLLMIFSLCLVVRMRNDFMMMMIPNGENHTYDDDAKLPNKLPNLGTATFLMVAASSTAAAGGNKSGSPTLLLLHAGVNKDHPENLSNETPNYHEQRDTQRKYILTGSGPPNNADYNSWPATGANNDTPSDQMNFDYSSSNPSRNVQNNSRENHHQQQQHVAAVVVKLVGGLKRHGRNLQSPPATKQFPAQPQQQQPDYDDSNSYSPRSDNNEPDDPDSDPVARYIDTSPENPNTSLQVSAGTGSYMTTSPSKHNVSAGSSANEVARFDQNGGLIESQSTLMNSFFSHIDKQWKFAEVILIIVISAILNLVTIIGNIMVLISFKMDRSLQTVSNYFLLSLALADLLIGLISMPLYTLYLLLNYWPLGPLMCDIWLAIDYLNSNAAVLNMLIISFDRYFSVTRPLTYRAKRTTKHACLMISCAWILSLTIWTPAIFTYPYFKGRTVQGTDKCEIEFVKANTYLTFVTAILAFYIPVIIMIYLYWRIWLETKKRYRDLTTLFLVSGVGAAAPARLSRPLHSAVTNKQQQSIQPLMIKKKPPLAQITSSNNQDHHLQPPSCNSLGRQSIRLKGPSTISHGNMAVAQQSRNNSWNSSLRQHFGENVSPSNNSGSHTEIITGDRLGGNQQVDQCGVSLVPYNTNSSLRKVEQQCDADGAKCLTGDQIECFKSKEMVESVNQAFVKCRCPYCPRSVTGGNGKLSKSSKSANCPRKCSYRIENCLRCNLDQCGVCLSMKQQTVGELRRACCARSKGANLNSSPLKLTAARQDEAIEQLVELNNDDNGKIPTESSPLVNTDEQLPIAASGHRQKVRNCNPSGQNTNTNHHHHHHHHHHRHHGHHHNYHGYQHHNTPTQKNSSSSKHHCQSHGSQRAHNNAQQHSHRSHHGHKHHHKHQQLPLQACIPKDTATKAKINNNAVDVNNKSQQEQINGYIDKQANKLSLLASSYQLLSANTKSLSCASIMRKVHPTTTTTNTRNPTAAAATDGDCSNEGGNLFVGVSSENVEAANNVVDYGDNRCASISCISLPCNSTLSDSVGGFYKNNNRVAGGSLVKTVDTATSPVQFPENSSHKRQPVDVAGGENDATNEHDIGQDEADGDEAEEEEATNQEDGLDRDYETRIVSSGDRFRFESDHLNFSPLHNHAAIQPVDHKKGRQIESGPVGTSEAADRRPTFRLGVGTSSPSKEPSSKNNCKQCRGRHHDDHTSARDNKTHKNSNNRCCVDAMTAHDAECNICNPVPIVAHHYHHLHHHHHHHRPYHHQGSGSHHRHGCTDCRQCAEVSRFSNSTRRRSPMRPGVNATTARPEVTDIETRVVTVEDKKGDKEMRAIESLSVKMPILGALKKEAFSHNQTDGQKSISVSDGSWQNQQTSSGSKILASLEASNGSCGSDHDSKLSSKETRRKKGKKFSQKLTFSDILVERNTSPASGRQVASFENSKADNNGRLCALDMQSIRDQSEGNIKNLGDVGETGSSGPVRSFMALARFRFNRLIRRLFCFFDKFTQTSGGDNSQQQQQQQQQHHPLPRFLKTEPSVDVAGSSGWNGQLGSAGSIHGGSLFSRAICCGNGFSPSTKRSSKDDSSSQKNSSSDDSESATNQHNASTSSSKPSYSSHHPIQPKSERKAAKTLSTLLLVFIVTWLPYNVLVLIKTLSGGSDQVPERIWNFSYYLCYINSTINPLCYALCNAQFRRTYMRILKCKLSNEHNSTRRLVPLQSSTTWNKDLRLTSDPNSNLTTQTTSETNNNSAHSGKRR